MKFITIYRLSASSGIFYYPDQRSTCRNHGQVAMFCLGIKENTVCNEPHFCVQCILGICDDTDDMLNAFHAWLKDPKIALELAPDLL